MDNLIELHDELVNYTYKHGAYQYFKINDPKPRDIHKASVKDRLVHHAIYRILYPFFDRTFTSDSFSCRKDKGTHRALNRFRSFSYQVSRNKTRTCWVLKCDIKKFFANISHDVLTQILSQYIPDQDILWLLNEIISSFSPGLPLGNLTSQLLVNIYMNEFDQFMKHKLKVKYYIRYADDFAIISNDRSYLSKLVTEIENFLDAQLKLQLHPDKLSIQTLSSGVDFLGWVHFPDHRVLRTTTKRRMLRKLSPDNLESYLGMLGWGNTYKLTKGLHF